MIEPIQKDADHRKWNEYPGVQLTTNAVQTYTEEETPDYWYIWVQPGINATVKVYPNGAGASGFNFPLASSGFACYPGRARSITIVGGGPSPVSVYVIAASADFPPVQFR